MPSLVAAQTILLSQIERGQGQHAETPRAYIASISRKSKSVFPMAFDALVQSRMRKAKYELKAHHRIYPDGINK